MKHWRASRQWHPEGREKSRAGRRLGSRQPAAGNRQPGERKKPGHGCPELQPCHPQRRSPELGRQEKSCWVHAPSSLADS